MVRCEKCNSLMKEYWEDMDWVAECEYCGEIIENGVKIRLLNECDGDWYNHITFGEE